MAGLLSISLSGLNAAQVALSTTSHNISNANTTGFNRQQVIQSAANGLYTGAGFMGQGTNVDTVRRVYSSFLNSQVLAAQASKAQYEAYYTQVKQIDNLLSDSTAGLSPALSGFFAGVQQVAADPSNVSARQSMLSSSQALTTRFQALQQRFNEVRAGVETQIAQSVTDINALASQISELNTRIVSLQAGSASVVPNDLMDQRDQLVAQLNEQVSVTSTANGDGSVNIFIGSGQPLVMGSDVYALSTSPSPTDPNRLQVGIALASGDVVQIPEKLLTGGTLGGLMTYRTESLDTAQNALGRIALTITQTFNAQHKLGQDLNGNMGGNYFTPITPDVQSLKNYITGAASSGSVTATISDVSQLTTDDYVLSYDGTTYQLARQSDGGVVTSGTSLPLSADGLSIDIPSGGTAMVAGDRVLIQPTRNAAENIQVAIKNASEVAAASAVAGTATNSNAGTGKISNVALTGLTGVNTTGTSHLTSGKITLTFDSTTNLFTVSPSSVTPSTISFDPSTDSVGKTFTFTNPAVSFTLTGRPQAGDTFTIGDNTGGTKDGGNANALYALQSAKVMNGGSASFSYAYSQLVSSVGTQTSVAKSAVDAQDGLLQQAIVAQQSVSGVNLDEEAANLIRYQQMYQASARCMNVAQTLFDTILQTMG